jgi:glycosyltransferase involved in cell wall biosynthesis
MRVGIFVTMAGRLAAGPETYEVSLVRALAEIEPLREIDVFCLSEAARASFRLDRPNVKLHVLRPASRWISMPVGLPFALQRSGCDFLHATLTAPPFLPKPLMFTVHDLTMLRNPEFYDRLIRMRLAETIRPAIKKARMLVCISSSVQRELQEEFRVSDDRVTVVHHGVSPAFRPVAEARGVVKIKLGIDRPYLLFVGQMKLRKNIVRILEAFARVREMGHDVALVLAGRRGHTSEGMNEVIARQQLAPHLIELGHVEDALLPALYSAAEAFVFPSLHEGFGLPVLESMACGTPVLTSNTSALPEIAGDAALLVDPTSVDEIADGLSRLLTDTCLRSKLITAGKVRSSHFTWESAAEQTMRAYDRMVN